MVVLLLSHAWDLFILLYDVDVHHGVHSVAKKKHRIEPTWEQLCASSVQICIERRHHKLRSQKYGFFFNPMSYNPTQTAKQFRK